MWWIVQLPPWTTIERPLKFIGGMVFLGHEVFIEEGQRPYLMVAILGLLGLTEMVRLDLKKGPEE